MSSYCSYPMSSRSGRGVEFECGGRWSNRMWASYIKRGSEGKWAGAARRCHIVLSLTHWRRPRYTASRHLCREGILSRQPRTRHPRRRVTASHGTGCACLLAGCHGNLTMLSATRGHMYGICYCHQGTTRGPGINLRRMSTFRENSICCWLSRKHWAECRILTGCTDSLQQESPISSGGGHTSRQEASLSQDPGIPLNLEKRVSPRVYIMTSTVNLSLRIPAM